MFVASFETVANALSWTLFLLAQHPAVAYDLYDELASAVGVFAPQVHQVDALPLLDAVLRESLRLFPPVPILYRTASRDTELGGRPVAEGDWVLCSPYVTQLDAAHFPAPRRFLPDRWFGARPDPYAYFPYGVGSYSCVGQHMGNTILKLCLSLIAQRWRLTVAPGARVDRHATATLAPRRGIPMRVWGLQARYRAVPVRGNVCDMVELDDASSAPLIFPMTVTRPPKRKRRAA
jgi:cytochrome P450